MANVDFNWGLESKEKESRRSRFERLGRSRMRRVLNTIRLLGNLATPNYQYNERDIAMMEEAIRKQAEKTFSKFKKKQPEDKNVDFSFAGRQ